MGLPYAAPTIRPNPQVSATGAQNIPCQSINIALHLQSQLVSQSYYHCRNILVGTLIIAPGILKALCDS